MRSQIESLLLSEVHLWYNTSKLIFVKKSLCPHSLRRLPTVPAILTQTLDEFVKQQVAEHELADEAAYYEKLAEAQRQRKIWDYYEQEVMKALGLVRK